MTAPAPIEPLPVRASEAAFLRFVRSLVGLAPPAVALQAIAEPHPKIELGPNGARCLRDILAKGVLHALVRGGSAPRRTLREGGAASPRARLWERHDPPRLPIGAATMDLLRTIYERRPPTASELAEPEGGRRDLEAGDEVVFLLATEVLVRRGGSASVPAACGRSRLVSLAFPFVAHARGSALTRAELTAGALSVLLEALRPRIAAALASGDRERRSARAIALTADEAYARGPAAFVRACIEAGRPDLGLPVLDAALAIVRERRGGGATFWACATPPSARLAERQRVARGVVPLFEAVLSFRSVERRARASRFVDDDYEAAQAILSEIEIALSAGGAGFDGIDAAVRELSSFDAGSGIVGDPG